MDSQSKNIFEYDNYRQFLRDYYTHAKSRNPNFSFRYFAKKAGFKSQNFLKQVIEGSRNLSHESIEKFAFALGLKKDETQFFACLVHFNQAKSADEKNRFANGLFQIQTYRRTHPLKELQYNLFSKWYYMPIRSLVSLQGFQEDPEWIAKAIAPQIKASEAKTALNELMQLGLLSRDPNGKLVQTTQNVATPDEVVSSSLAQTHKEFMRLAGESIDRFPRTRRDISSVTLQVSQEKAAKIKEMIQNFRRALVEEASSDSAPDQIYQINLQFFPLTSDKKEEDK